MEQSRTFSHCVGIIPTSVGTILQFSEIVPTVVRIIPTQHLHVLHFFSCVGILLSKLKGVGIFLQNLVKFFNIAVHM